MSGGGAGEGWIGWTVVGGQRHVPWEVQAWREALGFLE